MVDNLIDLITKIAWLLFAIYVIVSFVRTLINRGMTAAFALLVSWQIIIPLLLIISLNFLSASLVFIEPPQVGVVVSVVSSRGVRNNPLTSGLHWIIPFAERVENYPVYWQTYTMSAEPAEGEQLGNDSIRARTKDGQELVLDCSVIFRIDSKQAVRVYIEWQQRYIEDLVRPVVRGFVRTEVSQFTVTEVNSDKRKELETVLNKLLKEEFIDKGLVLDQFLLRDITFSAEYAASIEKKQIEFEGREEKKHQAEQMRQLALGEADAIETLAEARANVMVIEAEARAKAFAIEAEGKARALDLLGQAIENNPDVLTYEYIEKLSPNIRVMLLPNNTPLILPLPELEAGTSPTNTLEISPTLSIQTDIFTRPPLGDP